MLGSYVTEMPENQAWLQLLVVPLVFLVLLGHMYVNRELRPTESEVNAVRTRLKTLAFVIAGVAAVFVGGYRLYTENLSYPTLITSVSSMILLVAALAYGLSERNKRGKNEG